MLGTRIVRSARRAGSIGPLSAATSPLNVSFVSVCRFSTERKTSTQFNNTSYNEKKTKNSTSKQLTNLRHAENGKSREPNDVFHSTNVQRLNTVLDVYRFAVTQLHKHNVDFGHTTINAYEDAAFLILHELALPNDSDIRNWFNANLTAKEIEHLIKLIRRRCVDHVPSPYLVGGCYQQGLYFMVDERVLIPRSFIGEIFYKWSNLRENSRKQMTSIDYSSGLAIDKPQISSPEEVELDYSDYIGCFVEDDKVSKEKPSEPTKQSPQSSSTKSASAAPGKSNPLNAIPIDLDKIHTVLDMCTGSGCLAILAAKFLPHVEHVDCVDLSSDALNVAEENIESHGLDDIVDLHYGDLFAALPDSRKGYYDLIISNPPYVTKSDMKELPEEYKKEPSMALVAGEEGIDIVERICLEASAYLRPGGYLLCEIGQTAEALERKYGKCFSSRRTYVVTDDWMKSKLINNIPIGSVKDEKESVLWINTDLSNREVFLASKTCLEAIAIKRKSKKESKKELMEAK